jgi:cell wall-associated NlpC family hydrolase
VSDWRDILATPYRIGGRTLGVGIDCYGVTLEVARRIGVCLEDDRERMLRAFRDGEHSPTGFFPPCWRRLAAPLRLQHGDGLLWTTGFPHCGIVANGYLWSADAALRSPYAKRADNVSLRGVEVWRHDYSLHP